MMRLIDLKPKWFTMAHVSDGVTFQIGLTFLCPHCMTQRLGVRFWPPIDPAGWLDKITWSHVSPEWNRQGDTFETLTLTPSIDASGSGRIDFPNHWHGFIINGEVS